MTYKMSGAHKDALAVGRAQARTVKNYLALLEAYEPRRGRPRSVEGLKEQIADVDERIAAATQRKRGPLVRERDALIAELERIETRDALNKAEVEFISVAGDYSDRKGISYQAWRNLGVSAAVLRQAGIIP